MECITCRVVEFFDKVDCRRIRTKERELVLLRALPSDQYLSVDRLRRELSAKLLQRMWRRARLTPASREQQGKQTPGEDVDPFERRVKELYAYMVKVLPEPLEDGLRRHSGECMMHAMLVVVS